MNAVESTTEYLDRTCTQHTYNREIEFLSEVSRDTSAESRYLWRRICTMRNAVRYIVNNEGGTFDIQTTWHASARLLAITDWMDRIHDTADGRADEPVPVPSDYPFAAVNA